jgi:hypothetical protein
MIDHHIIFRVHAVQRMFERQILVKNVRQALQTGEMIEDYSSDMPDPGGLVLGKNGRRPIHVVMAENPEKHELVVITVYEPDPSQWKSGFRHRKE